MKFPSSKQNVQKLLLPIAMLLLLLFPQTCHSQPVPSLPPTEEPLIHTIPPNDNITSHPSSPPALSTSVPTSSFLVPTNYPTAHDTTPVSSSPSKIPSSSSSSSSRVIPKDVLQAMIVTVVIIALIAIGLLCAVHRGRIRLFLSKVR